MSKDNFSDVRGAGYWRERLDRAQTEHKAALELLEKCKKLLINLTCDTGEPPYDAVFSADDLLSEVLIVLGQKKPAAEQSIRGGQ